MDTVEKQKFPAFTRNWNPHLACGRSLQWTNSNIYDLSTQSNQIQYSNR